MKSVMAIEESISTLNYAQAANGIINKPVTTSFMTTGSAAAAGALATKPGSTDGGAVSVEQWHEVEARLQYMESQVEEAKQALARKHIQHQELVDRAEKAELGQQVAERNHEEAQHQISKLELILEATQRTEANLTKEARALIDALKLSINDGNSLHGHLLKKRQVEIECKVATKELHTNQLELFRKVFDYLDKMESSQNQLRSDVMSNHEQHKSQQQEHLKQHKMILAEMKENCAKAINEIQGSINDGVLPSYQSLVSSLKRDFEAIKIVSTKAGENIQAHCSKLSDLVNNSIEGIENIESSHSKASDDLLEDIVQRLERSKENFTEMVVSFSQELEKAESERGCYRSKLKDVLNESKISYDLSMDRFDEISNAHSQETNEVVSQWKDNAAQQRSVIGERFTENERYISESQASYIRDLEAQNAKLKASQARQKEMNTSLIANVMSTVQSILKKEMGSMSSAQDSEYEERICTNDKLAKSLSDTFGQLRTNNDTLNTDVTTDFANQDQFGNTILEKSMNYIESLRPILEEDRLKQDIICSKTTNILEQSASNDASQTKALSSALGSMVDSRTNELTTSLTSSIQDGIVELKQSARSMVDASKETAKQVQSDLVNDVQEPQAEMITELHENLEGLAGTLMQSEDTIVKESHKAIDSASSMKNGIDNFVDEKLTKNIDTHSGFVQNTQWLEAPLVDHEQAVMGGISNISSSIKESKRGVETFSWDVVRFEEDPPKIAERTVPSFTEELSATPCPDEILSSAGKENAASESISLDQATPSSEPLKDRATNTNTVDSSSSSVLSSTSKRPAEKKSMPASRLGKKAKI